MIINNNFTIGMLPTAQPIAPTDDNGEEQSSGKFDELFNTVFAASNTASEALSAESRQSTAMLITDQLDDLTAHLVTGEKSSTMFELNLTIRNKVLEAYSDILKTQI